ncbi:PRD domain-containing protein [uncultured Subdoligranulum sp.]|uniref:PRD domain-containing protein n=1 Tax=uncultured Subdoligranulum sp. TaxID=512298 RepID=UPI0025E41E03|nr:PRD domain-containing protein [uncultured Subdoligranulum sp.]
MTVQKILNNNLILATDEAGREQVVMGKGLRFFCRVGEELPPEHVQKVFVLRQQGVVDRYRELLQDVPPRTAEVLEEALQLAYEQFPGRLNDQLFVTLFDHLVYAIERCQKHIVLPNRLLWEVRRFYPREYAAGQQICAFLNERLDLDLPAEEAGNIAFHLVNAQTENPDMTHTLQAVRMLKDIYNIVALSCGQSIDENSVHYARFLTHMQYFIDRVLDRKMLGSEDISVLEPVLEQHPRAYGCAQKVAAYVQKNLGVEVPREELIYLTMHLARILN